MSDADVARPRPAPAADHDAAMQRGIAAAAAIAVRRLAVSQPLPVDPGPAAAELTLDGPGAPLGEVLAALERVVAATPMTAGPRFFNQLFAGHEPAALAAEMLTPLLNGSMYTFKVAGPQVLVEQAVVAKLLAAVGFTDGEGTFTPGGSLANLVAMLLARHAAVASARDDGLGAGTRTVYASAESHYSIRKNAAILGLGRRHVRLVTADGEGRMDPAALDRLLTADRAAGAVPVCVVATAGTTVLGAFDPLAAIADVTERHGVWLHVDGALGGTLLLSPAHRGLLAGSERADSFAWNAHKMMGVALQCSALLVRRRGRLAASLDETADYLFQGDDDAFDPGHRSLLCGRRNDALKLWAAWKHLGDDGWAARVERQLALARYAAAAIAADRSLELLRRPQSVTVCFAVRGADAAAVCERLDATDAVKVGYGTVDGRRAIRLVCVDPVLGADDIDTFLAAVQRTARHLRAGVT